MTKEELKQLRYLDMKIERMQRQYAQLQEQKHSLQAMDYSKEKVQQCNHYGIEDIITEIVDLEYQLLNDIRELAELKKQVVHAIQQLPDIQATIIHLRYVDGYSWKQISKTLHYSFSGIYKIHREALKKLKRVK